MIKTLPFVLWLTILTSSVGCSGLAAVDVGRVVTSGRDGWQHPERVVESLQIRPGQRVAEIGAGSGYWLPWLSAAVGPQGSVYAVEVDSELVDALKRRAREEDLGNVVVILGEFADPKLPDGQVDLAITSMTYHHIEDRPSYFSRLRIDLAPNAKVAHLDNRPDSPAPISWFQGAAHVSDPEVIVQEMAAAGYSKHEVFEFLPAQTFQVFVPEAHPTLQAPKR